MTALAVLALLVSVSCYAEVPPPPLMPEPTDPQNQNLWRLNLGVSFYNSGWYSCSYSTAYSVCTSGPYGDFAPFTLGVQDDINIGGRSYLTPGFQILTGTVHKNYQSTHMTLWSPTLDYVSKFGSLTSDIVSRARIGAVVYFGSDGHSGAGFRAGFGGSFLTGKRIGIGLDIVFEGSHYNGYWLSGIQLLASPEFHL